MILTVTLNPSVDKIVEIPGFSAGGLNTMTDIATLPGGKGVNVGMMLRALGHDVVAIGFAGNGPGRMVQNALRDSGITTSFTLLEGKTRTNTAIIDPDAGSITELRQRGPEVTPYDLESLRKTYERLLGSADMVLIAGSLPPGAEPSFCAELVRLAVHRGVKVTVNCREPIMRAVLPAKPYLAEPDLRTLRTYGDHDVSEHAGRVALTREIADSAELAVVNAGDEVLLVSGEHGHMISVPACELRGRIRLDDALVAGMIDATLNGGDLAEIGREGVAGALAAASSPNGQFAKRGDLEGCLSRVEVMPLA